MIPLVTGLMFVGYTLVFAAVHERGKYATRPWDTLLPEGNGGPVTSGSFGGSILQMTQSALRGEAAKR